MRGGNPRQLPISSSAEDAPAPAFLITIDTEGDDLWAAPREIHTKNASFLPRFQSLCEKHGFRPTYLVDWEMACCPVFGEFARDLLARRAGEIGMHLHAWNSPPIVPLTEDDYRWQPYLTEYPPTSMREKIKTLTETLRQTYSSPVVSHRAGRWALNEVYAELLVEHGYLVDCSMTPGVSWRDERGAPHGDGGADYRSVGQEAFWIDAHDVRRPGSLPLLEVPMTIQRGSGRRAARTARKLLRGSTLGRRAAERMLPSAHWLRPSRRNRGSLLKLLRAARQQGAEHVEMMLHSSELMPGGSPRFPDGKAIERLYDDLEAIFSAGHEDYRGMTLAEYYDEFVRRHGEAGSRPRSPSSP